LKVENGTHSMGIVAARKCPLCGHHEIGFTTRDGVFSPLKPGTLIQVIEELEPEEDPGLVGRGLSEVIMGDGTEEHANLKIWVPHPLRGDRLLRQKYGVGVKETLLTEGMSEGVYRAAYLAKLQRLIEKEIYVPLPVILDRFFTAPHLASGDSKEIAEAMWHEIKEIRTPVMAVREWLENKNEKTLTKLIHPSAGLAASDEVPSDEELWKEQEELTLEEFLALL
jgi:hypothetical protein